MSDVRKLGRVQPPRIARRLLRLALPRPQREFFLGDLEKQLHEEVCHAPDALRRDVGIGSRRGRQRWAHPRPGIGGRNAKERD